MVREEWKEWEVVAGGEARVRDVGGAREKEGLSGVPGEGNRWVRGCMEKNTASTDFEDFVAEVRQERHFVRGDAGGVFSQESPCTRRQQTVLDST